ncbi:MAG: hypothetical protein OXC13_04725, partial [Caldilineaceae bacterium]|nr:hypothetical protein [Caldilineaceae bacterium]
MARLSPDLALTWVPGSSRVPFADWVMALVFRSSTTTVWAVSASVRLARWVASSRLRWRWRCS